MRRGGSERRLQSLLVGINNKAGRCPAFRLDPGTPNAWVRRDCNQS